MDKKIGVLGGMGPMASQLFYKMVTEMTEADCDQDHVNMIIYSDPSMPDRTSAIRSGDYGTIHDKMLNDAKALEDCGCQAIGITCNTAHFFGDMIAKEIHVPLIHMIKETVETIARTCPSGRAAILATDGTVQTGLYQKYMRDAGLTPYAPEKEVQAIVMYEIYDRIKKGKSWDSSAWKQVEASIKAAGCDKAILGCTELSVIKEESGLDDFYVDPMRILAAKVIVFSGKRLKPEFVK